MLKFSFTVLCMLLPLTAIGQPNLDIERIDGLDVTAWSVTVSGDLLFVAAGANGLFIYDVSDPRHPDSISHADTPGNAIQVALNGDYAYVVDEGEGIRVFDVSRLEDPREHNPYDFAGWASYCMAISRNTAFIGYSSGGLRFADITNPDAIGNLWSSDDVPWLGWVFDVAVVDNTYLYAAGGIGLKFLDVSNPSAPRTYGDYQLQAHSRGITVSGNYLFVADQDSGIDIVDISTRLRPRLLATTGSHAGSSSSGVAVQDNLAFVADGGTGFRIFDISNPNRPTVCGQFDTGGNAMKIAVSDTIVFVADMQECGVYWFHEHIPEPEISCLDEDGNELGLGHPLSFEAIVSQVHRRTIIIRNDGEAGSVLTVNGYTVSGENTASFALDVLNSTEIPVGESIQLHVEFHPLREGEFTAQLAISNDDPNEDPYLIPLSGTCPPNSVGNEKEEAPYQLEIVSAYPNPFNEYVSIVCLLNGSSETYLTVMDIAGRTNRKWTFGEGATGNHLIRWNPDNASPGIYVLTLSGRSISQVSKVVYLK